MRLELLEGAYVVARMGAGDEVPPGLMDEGARGGRDGGAGLVAVTRTGEELSVVAPLHLLERPPHGAMGRSRGRSLEMGGPQRALRVAGALDHALTGVLLSLAAPLADAGVPIFAVSTFDTDYVLVPEERLEDALAALRDAGHEVAGP